MIQLGTTTSPMARAWSGKMSEELSVTMRTLEGLWPATSEYLPAVDLLIACPLEPLALCRCDITWGAGVIVIQGHPAIDCQVAPILHRERTWLKSEERAICGDEDITNRPVPWRLLRSGTYYMAKSDQRMSISILDRPTL